MKNTLRNAGVTHARAAAEMGTSGGSLYNIFKKDSFEIAYLLKVADLVGQPASTFLEAARRPRLGRAGSSHPPQIKAAKGQPHQDLAAALAACQRELETTRALVAAKDETIILLRGTYSRPT